MYRAGMCSILSQLAREERLKLVESFSVEAPKTKLLAQKLKQMGLDSALVITDELSDTNDIVQRGGRGAGSSPGPDGSAAMASGIRTIAERIEAIAARLESS